MRAAVPFDTHKHIKRAEKLDAIGHGKCFKQIWMI